MKLPTEVFPMNRQNSTLEIIAVLKMSATQKSSFRLFSKIGLTGILKI